MSVILEPLVQATLRTRVGPNEYGVTQILNQESELTVSQLAALMGGGTWVGTATSNLNMNGHEITNVAEIGVGVNTLVSGEYVSTPTGYFDHIAANVETIIGFQNNIALPGGNSLSFTGVVDTTCRMGFATGAFTTRNLLSNSALMVSVVDDTGSGFAIGPTGGASLFEADCFNDIVYVHGALHCGFLPITDPLVAGRIWNDTGTLKISGGP